MIDTRFIAYVNSIRGKLISAVVADQRALAVVRDLHGQFGLNLGDAIVAAVDTLLLRYIMIRFLAAYHSAAREELLPLAVKFSETELEFAKVVSRPIGVDGSKAKTSDLADLYRTAQGIQQELMRDPASQGSKLIQDFLGRTGDRERARWEFRYEDLRPKTLQDYYESSLRTAVQLTYDKPTDSFKIDVGESQRLRKELGAYYTLERLCRLMVERSVKPLFEDRLEKLRKAIASKNAANASKAFEAIVDFSVCDPTMGSGPFLRSAFDYLTEQYLRLCRIVTEAKSSLPQFYAEATKELPFLREENCRMDEDGVGRWEWHILRRMLYGVDIDLKAVNIACHTFTLSALKYIKQGERFPSFFNVNLKLGNALVSPTKPVDRSKLAVDHKKEIAELIKLRREAKTLPNTEEAYGRLVALISKADEIKAPIVRELVQDRLAPVLEKYTDELRPFCWELEFPELFFNNDGSVKPEAGIDVIIGNPPWESLEVETDEFFDQFHKGYRTLKPASTKTQIRNKLLEDHRIQRAFEHRRETVASLVKMVKPDAGFFELQHTVIDGERKRSEYATYKMILEQTMRLVRPAGRFSLLVPSGFSGDVGCYLIRKRIFETCDLPYIRGFRKSSGIFADVTQAFCVFYADMSKATKSITCLTGLSSIDDFEHRELTAIPFSVDLVKKTSPLSWAIPSISDAKKFSILDKMYKHPVLNEKIQGNWNVEMSYAELNASNNRTMFHHSGWDIPIWEGKLINSYERASEPRVGAKRAEFLRLKRADVIEFTRVVIRGVSGSDDPRRVIATVLPKQFAIMHSLNYMEPKLMNEETKIFIVACLNSFVLEWRVRQLATNNNISGFVIRQLPVPRLTFGDKFFDEIVKRSASLLLADPELQEPFEELKVKAVVDPHQRAKIRSEIDAYIALMYGLTEDDLQLVLDSFTEVDVREREAVIEAFRAIV